MDNNEQRRKRDRERYANMTDQERQKKLKKRREVYHQNKSSRCTQEREICKYDARTKESKDTASYEQ